MRLSDLPFSSLPRKRESRGAPKGIGANAWMPAVAGMTHQPPSSRGRP